ncbi:MAG: anhydro-N-acetylmuramic acid kinase [Thermomicrobiales bacterium]
MPDHPPASSPAPDDALCVGLMAGTSLDGIDAALVRIAGHARDAHLELIAFATTPYPDAVRTELLALYEDQANALARLSSLNVVIGELFAEATLAICAEAGVDPATLEVIGSHGQTVWHQPLPDPALPLSTTSTIQIGEAAVIAARTGAPVMADFRVGDIAVGGQGAPLAPYFDWAVFSDPTRNRAVQNIGGIGNITWLPATGSVDAVIAFDTGPGNMLIDGVVSRLTSGAQTYDRDGHLAAAGTPIPGMLEHLLEDAYLRQPPPKSTGREYYGAAMVASLLSDADLAPGALASDTIDAATRQRARDLVATVTAFTAHSIADACRRWLPLMPDDLLVNGGGCRNPVLMRMLADALPGTTVRATDAVGIDGDAKEAMLFALLAHDALAGLPTNIPRATGASRAISLGKLTRMERHRESVDRPARLQVPIGGS